MADGTQALKDFLALPMSIHMAVDRAQADGKIDTADIGLLLEPAMKIGPFVSALGSVPKQLADLTDTEKTELHEWAKGVYDIADDKVEVIVEKALGVALAIGQFISDLARPKTPTT